MATWVTRIRISIFLFTKTKEQIFELQRYNNDNKYVKSQLFWVSYLNIYIYNVFNSLSVICNFYFHHFMSHITSSNHFTFFNYLRLLHTWLNNSPSFYFLSRRHLTNENTSCRIIQLNILISTIQTLCIHSFVIV